VPRFPRLKEILVRWLRLRARRKPRSAVATKTDRVVSYESSSAARERRLLSVRSALVFSLSLLTAIGGGGLLYAAHRPHVLVILGALGIFAAAVRFIDGIIDDLSPHC
jgi:hypothetical protein